jgi:hypothetical protein
MEILTHRLDLDPYHFGSVSGSGLLAMVFRYLDFDLVFLLTLLKFPCEVGFQLDKGQGGFNIQH